MTRTRSFINNHKLVFFLTIAFGYTWIFQISAAVLAPERAQSLAFYIPSIYGPSIAALLMPVLTGGLAELKRFLSKRILGPVKIVWYIVAIFGIPTLLLALRGLHLIIFPEISLESLRIDGPFTGILVGFILSLPYGPLAEELGWRGYALPVLQKKMKPVAASLVLGVIWWAWHLPQLLIPSLQWAVGGMPILIYLIMILPGSVLAAWLFNRAGGGIVPSILFHGSLNYFLGLLGFNSPYFVFLFIGALWVVGFLIIISSGLAVKEEGISELHPELGRERAI